MIIEITDVIGKKVQIKPRIELYEVSDFQGKSMPGLAVVLDEVVDESEEQYAVLTVSFGEFICIKNSAYIDTNNCPFAEQLLDKGLAQKTQFTKCSGFCTYPLWIFNEDFLLEIGEADYKKYSQAYDEYFKSVDPT